MLDSVRLCISNLMGTPDGVPKAAGEVASSIFFYMVCSSMALVSNKVTITHLPVPASIFCLQIGVTILFVYGAQALRWIEVDKISWGNVKCFVPYICSFVISLYSNGRALASSNVETVIVFRACSPLCVSILDYLFLGRELPSWRSTAALMGVLAGAVGYVLTDSQFALNGVRAYFWVSLNLTGIVFEMTYGKRLISNIQFTSPVWGSVLYTNALALLPMFCMAASTGEPFRLGSLEVSFVGLVWLAMSCAIGVGISWSGWNCRSRITATAYTLVGVMCKFISVVLNMAIWDKHATLPGLGMLAICLISSTLYEQAPLRHRSGGSPSKATQKSNVPRPCQLGASEGVTGQSEDDEAHDEHPQLVEMQERGWKRGAQKDEF